MVLFEEPHLKIMYNNVPCRYLVTIWSGPVKSEQYKRGVSVILKCCQENGIKRLLSDVRNQDLISTDDQVFANELLKGYVAKHGRICQAVVLAGDVFMRFSSSNFDRYRRERTSSIQYFANEIDALHWLTHVDV